MSMEYIRETYDVPAKRGMQVIAQGRKGIIVGSRNAYLRIKIDGEKGTSLFHPTWEMEYLETAAEVRNNGMVTISSIK